MKDKKSKLVKETISWKNPDFSQELIKWGKHGEYFVAGVEINPKTGEGTIKLRRQK
jgi:hypothetical protein